MSAILYAVIHDIAKGLYEGPQITADNYKVWQNHWFEVAKAVSDDFLANGLIETSKAVAGLIEEQKKLLNIKN